MSRHLEIAKMQSSYGYEATGAWPDVVFLLSLLASPSAALISCLAVPQSYLSETTSGVVLDQVSEPGTGRSSLRSSYSKFIEPERQSFGRPQARSLLQMIPLLAENINE